MAACGDPLDSVLILKAGAAQQGKGAVSLDARPIDAVSIRLAENGVTQSQQIQSRNLA